jgi:NADH dehydrogenase
VILVAGGTGTLGTEVVRLLTGRGEAVRVLARDPARAAYVPEGVEIVAGDVRDPATLAAAVAGCATVLSAVHGFAGPGRSSPESVDRDANLALIRAAAAAGAEHLVLVSVLDAGPDHPMSLHRAKHAAEQALKVSGLAWTIVRPGPFLETWVGIVGAKLGANGPALVFGPGRNPIAFVSARDVAGVVDLAVRDPSLRGQVLEVTGPEQLSFTQLADRLVTGTGRVRHVPLPVLRAMSVLARPVAPAFARQAQAAVVMNTADMTARGPAVGDRFPSVPSTTLDELLERVPPRRPTP